MKKILFVCHGNICRSPMAEYVMKYLVEQAQLTDQFLIESAATSTEEIGNPIYPPALKCLQGHGIMGAQHRARQVTQTDYGHYDFLILMDKNNLRNLRRIIPNDPQGKISMLLEHVDPALLGGRSIEVADPWYTNDFETAYRDILLGCQSLMDELQ